MTRSIEILAVDVEHARSARPGLAEGDLIRDAVERGARLTAEDDDEVLPHDLDPAERLWWLRVALAASVMEASAFRWSLVTGTARRDRADQDEQLTYDADLELQRDIVPPLKETARELRQELRALEAEARDRGIDVEALEPHIDWTNTIFVDGYRPPEFESNETRRRAAMEFFRRVGPR